MEGSVDLVGAVSFIHVQPVTVLALLALGFLGGMLSGFIGSGGAFILTPGMMNLGVDGAVAVATNMCQRSPEALVGLLRRRKLGHVDIKLGLAMGFSAVLGVKAGVKVQEQVLATWGKAGSNLYVTVAFLVVLLAVGTIMLRDAKRAAVLGLDDTAPSLPQRIARLHLPPMINFTTAKRRVSFWVTIPLGFATGLLAATIAVGGFIGVPSMVYIIGAPGFVASGTELLVAFCMGLEGAFEYASQGLVDLRLTVIILAGSLIGVQVGALGTIYVRQYMVKLVSGGVMLLAALSRAMVIPTYLHDLRLFTLSPDLYGALSVASAVVLYGALLAAGLVISTAMVKGKREAEHARSAVAPVAAGEPY
ncbi:MAG: sulfite exporter TauE/SafE family protein [Chloroflexi bacterium]|nr:sulfite exporter TauE/SafE family protein [Chloroflexota bacterium]